jgi:hypothetical protein
VTPDMQTLREETKRLAALPAPGFAPQTTITVAGAIILNSAAQTHGVAVAVLQKFIAATVGVQEDLDRRSRLALIKKGPHAKAGFLKKRLSPESLTARFAPPVFLAPATTYHQDLTVAQQAKADAARAEAEAARPGES